MLASGVVDQERTHAFSRYSLIGALSMAVGTLAAAFPDVLTHQGIGRIDAFRLMFYAYGVLGLACAALYRQLPHARMVEPSYQAPMVFTHIPSNLFLILAAYSSNLYATLALLLLRSALSQMDVPTRTSYVMAVVTPAERATAASVTAVPRSLASAVSPTFAGLLLTSALPGLPLIMAGSFKILYDFALLYSFRHLKPPEEMVRSAGAK
jgi:hypothetical protein